MADSSLDTLQLQRYVARWQAGDRAAADELLQVVGGRLERLARRMLRGFPNVQCWAETADVLQGSLVRLLNSLRRLQPESTRHFANLAAVHVRRELLDLARRYARRDQTPLSLGEEIADRRDDDLELWCRFHEAVERLPEDEHEVVGLVFYHGWTSGQAAEILGVAERTVRRRWASACGKLHEDLGGHLPSALS